jgi:hypothetical protein
MKNNTLTKSSKAIIIFKAVLLILIILRAQSSFAQRRNGYLGLEAGVYATNHYDPGIGFHFSGNAEVANAMFVGAEVGVISFSDLEKPYIPLLVRFSAMPQLNSTKARLLVVVAPGYGIYDNSRQRNNIYYKTKGGFTFYGGAGAAFKGKGKADFSLTIGYSSFGFTTEGYKSNIDGVGIRFGVMFR